MSQAKHVVIAEDHPLFRTALRQTMEQLMPGVSVAEADSIDVLQRIMEKGRDPDMVLLDLNMPGAHGFSGLLFIRGHYPDCPVAVVSAREEAEVMRRVAQYGAVAYIPKSCPAETLRQALSGVISGRSWFPPEVHIPQAGAVEETMSAAEKSIAALTPQQFRILGMMAEGLLNKQIAWELNISEATVKAHATAIFKKLGVRNRTSAVLVLKELETGPDSLASSVTDCADSSEAASLKEQTNLPGIFPETRHHHGKGDLLSG